MRKLLYRFEMTRENESLDCHLPKPIINGHTEAVSA